MNEERSAQTLAFFPTPVWKISWKLSQEELGGMETEIRRQMSEDREGLQQSNHGGWHGKPGVLKTQPFASLSERIRAEVERINPGLRIDDGWANVNPPGSMNQRHIHARSVLSGVFYVRVPENSGAIVLEDPRDVAIAVGGLPDSITHPIVIPPEPGLLLLFPSWLPHRVEVNESNADRISIAFNARRRAES